MKNVLSDKQKYQLAQWLENNKDAGHTRSGACNWASGYLDFTVTYSNMKSAEDATGVSLVKAPAPKKIDLEARIVKLESDLLAFQEYCQGCARQGLSHIKPAQPKPTICHKPG